MSYSFAERLLEKVSPFFWSEEEGRLLLDAETLERSGDRYAKVYLALSMALLTFSAVSLGLLSNLMPVTAMVASTAGALGGLALLKLSKLVSEAAA